MTPVQARQVIEAVLGEIVPDADLAALGPDTDLREALELDSLDFLSFAEGLSQRSGRRIDEGDYPRIATLGAGMRFLVSR